MGRCSYVYATFHLCLSAEASYGLSCVWTLTMSCAQTSNNANSLSRYNLISALPVDLASFTAICLNFSQPSSSGIDIIALDLATSARLPFQLKRSLVLTAIANGAVFEVCYGVAMRSAAAASTGPGQNPISKDARRNVIAGARELIRITNGKGVILSSEVRSCMEMRAPLDLCNLCVHMSLELRSCLTFALQRNDTGAKAGSGEEYRLEQCKTDGLARAWVDLLLRCPWIIMLIQVIPQI